jgi:gentisate 1,2-dioxygenase
MASQARTPEAGEARSTYYAAIGQHHLAPLWERLPKLLTRTPRPAAQAALWRFAEIRPHLMRAGALLSTDEAERRVLLLENPGLPGASRVTGSLFAGLQLLLPGERAPAHRHVANALRFILEGSGAYTAVDGERTTMERGDFILTPGWTWHDHGHDGDAPVIWLDGLDVPLVNFFDTSFAEQYAEAEFPVARPAGDCEARYGAALLPDGARGHGLASPLLNYRYARAREALAMLSRNGSPDPCHGFKLHYANPLTGGPALPTIAAALQLLPAGLTTAAYRSTDSTVFAVAEGTGRSWIGEREFAWGPNDIFVAPSWLVQRHAAADDAVLFSFSDRAAQEKLGIWREQRHAA